MQPSTGHADEPAKASPLTTLMIGMLTNAARTDIAGRADAIWQQVRAFPQPHVVSLDEIRELVAPTAIAVLTVYGMPGYALLQHLVATQNIAESVAVPGLEPGNPPL